jgi:DNA repair protein RecN (Recombination protein N)
MSKIILRELHIQNFATIINEKIQFQNELNCIVGETGSGKSLILDALQLIFGARADKKVIRKGCDTAIVEAVFTTESKEILGYFESLGFPFDGNEIIIKRIISKEGSKSYLNFQNCPNTILNKFSKRFIDLVGQFDNQKLMSSDYQLKLLDEYCSHTKLVDEYYQDFSSYKSDLDALEESKSRLAESSARKDYIQFQLNEIEKIDPSIEEEEELISKKDELRKTKDSQELLQSALHLLSEGDNDILSKLGYLKKSLLGYSEKTDDILLSAIERVEELSFELSKDCNEFEEESYQKIVDRLDELQKIKRKFGGSIEAVIETQTSLQEEFEEIDLLETRIKELENKLSATRAKLWQKAEVIHKGRVVGAGRLAKEITEKIQNLNMSGASVKLELTQTDQLASTGVSQLKFLAETNQGEGFFEFKDIASGGELSRMLLSMRTILSSKDSISIFLFDEIDTGIGGKTAKLVGKALSEVSDNGQVIAITHLPQIANFANNLIIVDKSFVDENNRTSTKVNELTKKTDREVFINQMADFR